MKKCLLLLLLLASCKTLEYNDLNPEMSPNPVLLPAMDTLVDINNLESTYSSGTFVSQSNSLGTGYVNNNFGGWFQTTSTVGTQYKDPRVSDIINILNKEVKDNITTPYGEKKGYISLSLGYRGRSGTICPVISALTLFTINVIGFPFDKETQSLEVEVQIMNRKREVIRRYKENVLNSDYSAMWYGYDIQTLQRKLAADNIKEALKKIRYRIKDDAIELKKELK